MNFVLITGAGAVGKMTVGKRLSERTGYGFMHNHIAIEPVLQVAGSFDNWAVSDIRRILIRSYLANNLESEGFISTLMVGYDRGFDFTYIDSTIKYIEELISPREVNFYYVELIASLDVRVDRNKSEFRLEQKPSKRDIEQSEYLLLEKEESARRVSLEGEVEKMYPNYIRIYNDSLSVDEQVSLIMNKFGF